MTSYAAPQPVLHVRVVSGPGGGPDKTILRSPRYVDPQRYPMRCVYLYPKADPGIETLRAAAHRYGAELIAIPEHGPIDVNAVYRLLALCREHRIAIWHGHDYKSDLLGLMLRRLHPMKLVSTAHGFTRESARTRLYYHVDNFALRSYDHVIAVSPPLVEHCRRLGIADDRLSYVPNAIEPSEYVFSAYPRKVGSCGAVHLGVIGRFSVEKGVDRAIRLLTQLPQVHLHLVGDGPQRAALESLARELNVFDRITWHGWQKDVRSFYEKFDLLLLPSHTEGLPNVVLEAMALGVPVAATNVGGVGELLDGGRLGVLLDAKRTEQWPVAIQHGLQHPPDTAAARRWIEHRYSFAARMQKITDIYDQLTLPVARTWAA